MKHEINFIILTLKIKYFITDKFIKLGLMWDMTCSTCGLTERYWFFQKGKSLHNGYLMDCPGVREIVGKNRFFQEETTGRYYVQP
jgi:hypothetical protein